MANIVEGKGKYGVLIKWGDGGTTTYYFEDKAVRNQRFSVIKGEVGGKDKVSKKDR